MMNISAMNISAENLIGFVGNNGETYALQSHAFEVGWEHGIGIRDPGEHVNQIGDLDWQAGKLGGFKLNPFSFPLEAVKLKTRRLYYLDSWP